MFVGALESVKQFEELALEVRSALDLSTLRQQLYQHLLGKVNAALQATDSPRFAAVLKACDLPVRKDQVRKQGVSEQQRLFLLGGIYRETCLFAVRVYLQGLLEVGEGAGEGESILEAWWQPAVGAVGQLFISNAQLRNL